MPVNGSILVLRMLHPAAIYSTNDDMLEELSDSNCRSSALLFKDVESFLFLRQAQPHSLISLALDLTPAKPTRLQ